MARRVRTFASPGPVAPATPSDPENKLPFEDRYADDPRNDVVITDPRGRRALRTSTQAQRLSVIRAWLVQDRLRRRE